LDGVVAEHRGDGVDRVLPRAHEAGTLAFVVGISFREQFVSVNQIVPVLRESRRHHTGGIAPGCELILGARQTEPPRQE
jgi:hypothetical protein